MVGQSFCRDCGELRPADEFTSDRRRSDGLSFYCKTHARRRLLRPNEARQGPPKSGHRRELQVPDGHRWCPDCSTVKSLDQFVRNASQPSGWAAWCKPCHNARGKAAKERVGGSRTYHLKRRYGITSPQAAVRNHGGRRGRHAGSARWSLRHLPGSTGRARRPRSRDRRRARAVVPQPQGRPRPVHGRPGGPLRRGGVRRAAPHPAGSGGGGGAGSRPGTPARPGTPPVGSAQRRNGRSSAARRGPDTPARTAVTRRQERRICERARELTQVHSSAASAADEG
jgi:hypothetical protein